ncbi:hypothetical protein NQT62_07940 [Limnobacter humi]|uniref:Uncharacterized protein n=1 Tax=Limnobacter humi TaxID=1778671 RepID=A0ABT1WHM3_9BURK|nr:hypothetical protein [Limnobacter humi]MCQ8896363.1 hypothetical protein [Limnobacter humi]
MSIGLNSHALIKTLAGWVNQQRNPYEPDANTDIAAGGGKRLYGDKVAVPSTHHGAWAEFQWTRSDTLELTCIHQLLTLSDLPDRFHLREEIRQFNRLMEKTRLPVVLWANTSNDQLELRWQEQLTEPFQLSCIERVFSHSVMMANALSTRYAGVLPRPAGQTLQ